MSETGVYTGELMDGQTAAVKFVTLRFEAGHLRIESEPDGVTLGLWPLTNLKVDPLVQGVLHLSHPAWPDALLTVRDPSFGHALDVQPTRFKRGSLKKRIVHPAVLYGAAIAAVVTGVYLSLPALSGVIARRIPLSVEAQMGAPIDDFLAKRACATPESSRAMASLVSRLDQNAGGAGIMVRPEHVMIVNLKPVNAFAFPGGRIALTRGLLDKAESPDEIAGVLAHEMEHVRQRHIMAHVVRSSILGLGWAVTVGDFSGLFVVDPSTAFQLANLRFSREDERSADAGALSRLQRALISPAGFAKFFERLKGDGQGIPEWLSTHPQSESRVARIGAQSTPSHVTPALGEEAWNALKTACAGLPPGGTGFFFDED